MSNDTTTAPLLRNIRAVTGTVVHRAILRRPFGGGAAVPAPACLSLRQLERQIATGMDTDAAVTCTRPKCQG